MLAVLKPIIMSFLVLNFITKTTTHIKNANQPFVVNVQTKLKADKIIAFLETCPTISVLR